MSASDALSPVQFPHQHPTQESVQNIVDHYGFEDATPSGSSGPKAWASVKEGYYPEGHPANKAMRDDIKNNGIHDPIRIDYHRDPPVVTDGHTRLVHAASLGMSKVPVKQGEFDDVHFWEPRGEKTTCPDENGNY